MIWIWINFNANRKNLQTFSNVRFHLGCKFILVLCNICRRVNQSINSTYLFSWSFSNFVGFWSQLKILWNNINPFWEITKTSEVAHNFSFWDFDLSKREIKLGCWCRLHWPPTLLRDDPKRKVWLQTFHRIINNQFGTFFIVSEYNSCIKILWQT